VDLRLYVSVLWRFKAVLVLGFCVATLLAVMAFGSVSFAGGKPSLAPRGAEVWQAQSTLLISQEGFPYGRAVPKYVGADQKTQTPAVQLGDQSRFSALSNVYSQMANSDEVQARLKGDVPIAGTVKAEAAVDPNGIALPLLNITTQAGTAAEASKLVAGATSSFRDYVTEQQSSANIPQGERIELQVLDSGRNAVLFAPRKKTLPVLVFMAVMAATFTLVLVLENARPHSRPRAVPEPHYPDLVPASAPAGWTAAPAAAESSRRTTA
jgi:hypothetical protein